jgi:hypothetical protein
MTMLSWMERQRDDYSKPPPIAWINWEKLLANLPVSPARKRSLDRRSIGVVIINKITGAQMLSLTAVLKKAGENSVGFLRHMGAPTDEVTHNIAKQLGFKILIHPTTSRRLPYYNGYFSILAIKENSERLTNFIDKCDALVLLDNSQNLTQRITYVRRLRPDMLFFTINEEGDRVRVYTGSSVARAIL